MSELEQKAREIEEWGRPVTRLSPWGYSRRFQGLRNGVLILSNYLRTQRRGVR